MKKSKVLAAALISALILTGAGYAVWTDSLKVTTVAKTGEMKVKFLGNEKIKVVNYIPNSFSGKDDHYVEILWKHTALEQDSDNYINTSFKKDISSSSKAIFTLNNLYPGSGASYAFGFENESTIPIKIDSIVIENLDDEMANNMIALTGGFRRYSKKSDSKYKFVQWSEDNNKYKFLDGKSDKELAEIDIFKLSSLETQLNDMLKNVVMEPGDIISLDLPDTWADRLERFLNAKQIKGFDKQNYNCIILGLPDSVDNNALQGKTCSFTMTVNFKQLNE